MSDFAAALGALQKSAKRVAAANTTAQASRNERNSYAREEDDDDGRNSNRDRYSIGSGKKRQRHYSNDDNGRRQGRNNNNNMKHSKVSYPSDYHKLRISVGFFCIGAQKGGTTWLHEMLSKCPGLVLPQQKEIHFWDWHRRKGLGWYSDQFQSTSTKWTTKNTKLGEITPCYMALEEDDICEIHQLFPSARIIFLARNIVDRAWSALVMELRNAVRGMEAGEFQTLSSHNKVVDSRQLRKMEEEANPDRYNDDYFIERLEHSTHSTRNDYARGLRRWLKYFPKDQLLILRYEDIAERPKELLRQVLEHTGITDIESYFNELEQGELKQKYNVGSNKTIRPSLRKKMEQHLLKNTEDTNALLRELGYNWSLGESSHH